MHLAWNLSVMYVSTHRSLGSLVPGLVEEFRRIGRYRGDDRVLSRFSARVLLDPKLYSCKIAGRRARR